MNKHIPVMLAETIEALNIIPNHWYVDATFGRGGHTEAIIKKGGNVIAFDQDQEAIAFAQATFKNQISDFKLILVHENFNKIDIEIKKLEQENDIGDIKGILFDFGTSTEQLTSSERGFSFENDGPLDMRMDRRLGVQAKDLLVVLPENQLEQLFREYGGEEQARAIAKAVKRSTKPITTIAQLRSIIMTVKHGKRGKLHPATKVFQALRIAVNSELESIQEAMNNVLRILSKDGKLVTIAFHEGEDRIVKNNMKTWFTEGLISEPQRIKPTEQEIAENPRSRSAVLRTAQKL